MIAMLLFSALSGCFLLETDWWGDAIVDCGPSARLDVEAAIAEVDTDGDGVLTDQDLASGQVALVLEWTGEGRNGVSVHVSELIEIYQFYADWDPSWTARIEVNDCSPDVRVYPKFYPSDRTLSRLPEGELVFDSIGFDVPQFELAEDETSIDTEGSMIITDAGVSTLSGYLDGYGRIDLLSRLGETRTGQTLHVHAFAFRDVATSGAE